ncbi:DUF4238 domain-containing protein [Nocardia sp. NPDC057227]|uniref:DUF4238 domain-containing protein n=1 Tax=Nocardia sp. NPDC057227 TaxID=3346056 RepID=UPI00363DF458
MRVLDEEWFRTVDRFGKVGSRHHVIPRFLLQKWADSNGQVWVKSKHDRAEGRRNTRDLGIKDFYTFLATDGQLDSTVEEMLSVIEKRGADVLKRLNNPYFADVILSHEEFIHLCEFVAIQVTRSPRRRREHELLADWYGKTVAAGTTPDRITEDDLRGIEFSPHQNEHIGLMIPMADELARQLLGRPVYLVSIDRPIFLLGDEAVVLNTSGDAIHHQPECAVTEEEFKHKLERAVRKKRRRRPEIRRITHLYTTQPRDIRSAVEIAMPISPRTVLLFGSEAEDWEGRVVRERIHGPDAGELAAAINERIVEYSLDVIVGRVEDESFRELPIPERAPLMAVCGSGGAAQDAVMSVPRRLRPNRLNREARPVES